MTINDEIDLMELTKLVVEIPGSNVPRRLSLEGAELEMLPVICALGAESAHHANTASSFPMDYGTTVAPTVNATYFDIPVGNVAGGQPIRVTIGYTQLGTPVGGASIELEFTALEDRTNRNLMFTVDYLGQATRLDKKFRSDASAKAVIVTEVTGATDFTPTARDFNITEINYDGLPEFTYDNTRALLPDLDEVIWGSTDGTNPGRDFYSHECYFLGAPTGVSQINIESGSSAHIVLLTVYSVGGGQ